MIAVAFLADRHFLQIYDWKTPAEYQLCLNEASRWWEGDVALCFEAELLRTHLRDKVIELF